MHVNDPEHIEVLRRFSEVVVSSSLSDEDWDEIRRVLDRAFERHDDAPSESAYARRFRDPEVRRSGRTSSTRWPCRPHPCSR
ncbi:MAG: hypothetical protein R2726_06505 [Acidimicrobiales bacterium]